MQKASVCVSLFVLTVGISSVTEGQVAKATGQTLSGRVVDANNGAALARARVVGVFDGQRIDSAETWTDDDGGFLVAFPSTPSALRVTKAGYVSMQVRGPSLDSKSHLNVTLERGASISGRVTDRLEPVVAAQLTVRRLAGRAFPEGSDPAAVVETNDLGAYRIGGLSSGRYEVALTGVRPQIGSPFVRPMESKTRLVMLSPGGDVDGMDFSIGQGAGKVCSRIPTASVVLGGDGAASINGTVSQVSGAPIGCARVSLLRAGAPIQVVTSDDRGHYVIENLPSGRYTLQASRSGYLAPQFDQGPGFGRTTVEVKLDQALRVDIRLERGSAVTGKIFDDYGEPVQGITVRALQLRSMNGRTVGFSTPGARAITDDRGQYRVYGLMPGAYLIVASADAGISGRAGEDSSGFGPVYYPGTTNILLASRVEVGLGRDRADVDLALIRSRTSRVFGLAFDENGRPATGFATLAVSQRSAAILLEPRTVTLASDGAFSFQNVPDGDYVVQVHGRENGSRFGMRYVTVLGADSGPVYITASGGSTVEGRIVLDDLDELSKSQVLLSLIPVDFDRSPIVGLRADRIVPSADGKVRIDGVTGVRRFVLESAPANWYLESVAVDGVETVDAPVDFGEKDRYDVRIVLSRAGCTITGDVVDTRGQTSSAHRVIAFAREQQYWFRGSRHLRIAEADQNGVYRIEGLPPGNYWIVAVNSRDGEDESQLLNPVVLERLAFSPEARKLDLSGGTVSSLSLRLTRPPTTSCSSPDCLAR